MNKYKTRLILVRGQFFLNCPRNTIHESGFDQYQYQKQRTKVLKKRRFKQHEYK